MCQLETFSPVLSEAEERMGRELEGMLGKMALLERRLVEVRDGCVLMACGVMVCVTFRLGPSSRV